MMEERRWKKRWIEDKNRITDSLINKFNNDYLIIQDNDPKHNSDKCYNYMVKNKFKCVIDFF